MENENTIELTEHEQSMIEVADNKEIKTQEEATGVDIDSVVLDDNTNISDDNKILGKFNSQEDLEKAYTELQAKMSSGNNNENNETDNTLEVTETVDIKSKLDDETFDKYSKEYAENGELSSDTYKELEKSGLSKNMVDRFVQLEVEKVQTTQNEYFDIVGGKDNYNELQTWASENLNEVEKKIFNSQVNSGDNEVVKYAIKSLKDNYDNKTRDTTPNLINGKQSNTKNYQGYNNKTEMKADMNNIAYKRKDPHFVAMVIKKMGLTKDGVI